MRKFDLQRFAGEKTERATPQRRREAREEGRIPKSVELTSAVVLIAVLASLRAFGSTIWADWTDMVQRDLTHITTGSFTQTDIKALLVDQTWQVVRLLAPLLGGALALGALTAFAQVGPVFLPKLLTPNFQRIDPLAGLKRMWSVRSAVEAGKSVIKLMVVGVLAYSAVRGIASEVGQLMNVDLASVPGIVAGMVFRLGLEIAALMLALAFLDFLFQRFEFERSIRMSREDIREEAKRQDGDPLVRARIRQRGRAIAMQRMMQNVPKADVVVTNPTHFAVALQYDATVMAAPTVLAKGQDEVARRIRAVATDAAVPTVENKPLAQSLYRTVDIGQQIPAELFQAVAEVLAHVYRGNQPPG